MNDQRWQTFFTLAAQEKGLSPIARLFLELTAYPLVICDMTLRILSSALPAGAGTPDVYLPASILDTITEKDTFYYGSIPGSETDVPFRMLKAGENTVLGYVLQLGADEHCSPGSEELRAASLAVSVELSRRKLEQDIEWRYRDEFIQDILYNNIPNRDAIYYRGQLWGWNLRHPHMVVVITTDETSLAGQKNMVHAHWRQVIAHYLAKHEPSVVVGENRDQLILLIPMEGRERRPNKGCVKRIIENLRLTMAIMLPDFSFSVASGRFYQSVSELYRAYQEAKVALEIKRLLQQRNQLIFFDELGAVRFIYNQGEQDLIEYYEETLGPLDEHDKLNNTTFMETLAAFLQASGDPAKAAETLFIHVNTLRYRLKQIEELLQQDVRQLNVQANLYIAYQVKAILNTLVGHEKT